MSDTINKQALLEWLEHRNKIYDTGWDFERSDAIESVMEEIKSGKFDYTTEPTGAERVRELLRNPMAAGSYRVGVMDACKAFGINISKEDTNE